MDNVKHSRLSCLVAATRQKFERITARPTPKCLHVAQSIVVLGLINGVDAQVLELTDLNGTNGFVIDGNLDNGGAGLIVSAAGDMNGDGIDDLAVASAVADVNTGMVYVVFGRSSGFGESFDLGELDGTNGFSVTGVERFSNTGISVSAAGDVNNDGIGDLLIGANGIDFQAGQAYLIFGKDDGFEPNLELSALDGGNGVVIDGVDPFDELGRSVNGAGDINNDGIDDLLLGAFRADPNGLSQAGEAYLVFGREGGFGGSIDLASLDGMTGTVFNGINPSDISGIDVSGAGDINDDGVDDLIIGASGADPRGILQAGESYIVFGNGNGLGASFDLSALDGVNGSVINGIAEDDFQGGAVSKAGDFNGDGISDAIVAAQSADPNGIDRAGEVYVVFGQTGGLGASLELDSLDGTNGFVIRGDISFGFAGHEVSAAGDVNGDGFDDVIFGLNLFNASESAAAYLIFGRREGLEPVLNVSDLDGKNGVLINSFIGNDVLTGVSVAGIGDINADGFDDLIVGSPFVDAGGVFNSGRSYVIFGGSPNFPPDPVAVPTLSPWWVALMGGVLALFGIRAGLRRGLQ